MTTQDASITTAPDPTANAAPQPRRAHPRTALVTGAASGLGACVTAVLQAAGCRVAGVDLSPGAGDVTIVADVSDAEAVARAVDEAVGVLGGLDAVACCAGMFRNRLEPVGAMDVAEWRRTIDVNLTGSFLTARACLPHLETAEGSLVLVASTAAQWPQPGGAAYAASKAGVAVLARAIALEYGSRGVRCNSVSPGYMETGMTAALLAKPERRAALAASIPAGRVADPMEVARTVAFLLGPDASFISGADVLADGGGALTGYATTADVARMWHRHHGA